VIVSLELWSKKRSGADLGSRRCYFVKLKHLHCPHHQLLIHLPHPCCKDKSTGWEHHHATVDDGGVRIKGAGALQRCTTSAMDKARQNQLTTLVAGPSDHVCLRLPPIFEPEGGYLRPQS
jgi:hypothetical protein